MAEDDPRPADDQDDAASDAGRTDDEQARDGDVTQDPPESDDADKPAVDDKAEDEGDRPTAAEHRKVTAALAKANEEARRHRIELRKLKEQQAAEKRKGESEHEKALREAREQAAGEVEKRYKPIIVRGAARSALLEAGAVVTGADGKPAPGRLDRVLRLIDVDELEVGEDGEVSGLDAQVDQIRRDYPEFFERPKPPVRPKGDAADRKPEPAKPRTSAEKLAAALGGGRS